MSKTDQQTFILELKILSKILRSSWIMDRSTLALLGERHLMLEKTIIPLIPDSTFITPEVAQKLNISRSYVKLAIYYKWMANVKITIATIHFLLYAKDKFLY